MMLEGYRIVPAAHAATAFDGEGARLYGGRWNSIGVPMVYASKHRSLAALETRVHIDRTKMLRPYKCIVFHFDAKWLETLPPRQWPVNWRLEPPSPATQRLGDAWIKAGRSALLAVPSVIIPGEQNFLLNPKHSNFTKIKFDKPVNFTFDSRLFK
jgi:RES domain-containing protein